MAERRDVIRTRKALCTAYIDLLFLKPKDKITVRDILERANFSHGTFYAHFRDIEELEKHVGELIIEDWRKAISQAKDADVDLFLKTLEPRREELRALAQSGNLLWISDSMKAIIVTAMLRSYPNTEMPELTTFARCFTGALIDATLHWLVEDDADREAFVKTVRAFLNGGTQAYVNLK